MPKVTSYTGLVSALAVVSLPAHSQQAASASADTPVALEEVVVTARKREERLQDTPIAVTAFNAEALAERSVTDLTGIGSFTPNLTLKAGGAAAGGNNTQIFIRGVGQDDFLPTADPGVGVYVDGVYLGRSVGGLLRTADIAQLEVLRGPQGTLFGRNTIGGAINIRTIDPDRDEFNGTASLTVGDDSLYGVNASISGPFSERAAGLLSASIRQRDGYGRSTASPIDFGNEYNWMLRAKVAFDASDSVSIVLSGDYFQQDQTNQPVVSYALVDTSVASLVALYNNFLGRTTGAQFTSALLGTLDNPYISTATGPSQNDATVYGVAATIDWNISPSWDFKSITAYRSLDAKFSLDNDATSVAIAETNDVFTQDQLSQELQLGFNFDEFRGIVGAYYFQEEGRDQNAAIITPGLYGVLETLPVVLPAGGTGSPLSCALATFTPVPGTPFRAPPRGFGLGCSRNIANTGLDNELFVDQTLNVDNYAFFVQGTYAVTEQFSVTAGLRYTYEEKKFNYFQQRLAVTRAINTPFYSVRPVRTRESWDDLSPRLGLEYKAQSGNLFYASYSQGFKSGTFNGRATQIQGLAPVDPETVDQFEFGFKSQFADDRVRLNVALDHSDYQDIQLQTTGSDPQLGLAINLVNAAEAKVQGAELELVAKPTAAFDFGASLGFTDSEVKKIDPAVSNLSGIRQGVALKRAPEFNGSAFGQYRFLLGSGAVTLRADYSYVDDQFHDAANNPVTIEDSYGLLNLRAAFANAADTWEVALYGTNVTDEVVFNTLFLSGGAQAIAYPARGRECSATLRLKF